MPDGTINGVDPYALDDWERCEAMYEMPKGFKEKNPWRRQVEAKAYVEEAMRLLSGSHWQHARHLLDLVSDAIEYSIDACGYNSWEYAHPLAGKHEDVLAASGETQAVPTN